MSAPPSTAALISGSMRRSSVPLGPSTRTTPSAAWTRTPCGRGTGCLPMRDIFSLLPDRAEYFATDVRVPGVAVDQEPLGGREHADAKAAEHGGNLLRPDVDAEARPADALQAPDHRPPLGVIAELDAEDRPWFGLDDGLAGGVTLGHEHFGERLLLPGPRHVDGPLARGAGVADAGEEVGDRVRQHGRLTRSPSRGPEPARGATDPASRGGTCGSGGRMRVVGRTADSGCRRAP